MNNSVAMCRTLFYTFQVIKIAAMHLSTGFDQFFSRAVRAGQPKYLVAGL